MTAKKQARLAAQMPTKQRSHHVAGVVEIGDSEDEDDADDAPVPRRRQDVKDKWERARRERSRDRARETSADASGGENLDLAWLKPDDPYGDYDAYDGDGDEMDPLQAELRTEGLGRGNRKD